tara:strand:- start:137 stop:841 length:705 start_codon:yes stop_codon:yes gene_type:complete
MISVTFLIPVYNEVKTLENAILEVLKLDYPKKEIIIIDNNSIDGSKQILEKFINNNNLKIIFKDKNLGYGDTIKKGFALAKGEVMYIQYSDSEYSIDGFFLMIEKYNKTRADIIFGERYPKFSFIQKIKESVKRPQYLGTFLTTSLINYLYDVNLNDIIGSKMYKTFTFKKFEINRNNNGFDFELVSRIMKKKLNIDKILVPYKSRKNSSDKKIKFYHMFYALYEILRIKFFTK